MSYVAPNSTIILLEDCPLDSTYDHTIKWNSATEQYNYFYSLRKLTLDNATYQRVNKGTLKVQVPNVLYNIYNCNYLMFRNESFENKWFYAFITRCDYVNNITYEVSYEIDVMQTWYFDYEVDEVFVERENTGTDAIGDNLVVENLELGDYEIVAKLDWLFSSPADLSSSKYVIACTVYFSSGVTYKQGSTTIISRLENDATVTDYAPDIPTEWNGTVYSGLNYLVFDSIQYVGRAVKLIIAQKGAEAIIGIYQAPKDVDLDYFNKQYQGDYNMQHDFSTISAYTLAFANYIPVNKKLYTYPYTCLLVTDNQGNSGIFRFEFFPDSTAPTVPKNIVFRGMCSYINGIDITCVPVNYKLPITSSGTPNYLEGFTISSYPMCSWSSDLYQAWLAQNKNSFAVSNIMGVLGGTIDTGVGIGRALGGDVLGGSLQAVSGVVGTAGTIANSVAKVTDMKRLPPQAHSGDKSSPMALAGRIGLFAYRQSITKEYARKIDRYFSKFGYAVKEVKVPNVFTSTACANWNYIRTKGCTLTGSVPNDDLAKISQIYNNGITFWNEPEYVGNYSHYGWSCR